MARKPHRISEADLFYPTLKVLAKAPSGRMTTSDLIAELEAELHPSGEDAEILEGRNDTKFSQIVRNMVSHKEAPGNIIAEGFVAYRGPRHGLEITAAGRHRLASRA